MRITNSILLRGYNRDLNRLMTQKTACERRITSTRKFSRASENPLNAAKALNVRRSMYNSEQYQENLKTANEFYTEAETSLLQVSDKMATVREELIAACNTTKGKQEYAIYGEHLETLAKELVAIFNTDSAGRAIFGGESDDAMPFTFIEDSTGHISTVCYHGVPVNAMDNYKNYPYSTPVTVDIGLGMAMDQKTQEVNPLSVLDISFNGAKITGCGAERSTADIDLTSIRNGRKYCIDVYAGSIKKTIEFIGKGTQEENVQELNAALATAYGKEVAYNKISQPTMDAQGVIYCEDGSLVSAVNNEYNQYAEKLVVDNDAGYTSKYKVNVKNLAEGQVCSMDVSVDGGDPQTIVFTAGEAANLEDRYNQTLSNIQDALDGAFGAGTVNISKNPMSTGVITSEGKSVKVISTGESADTPRTKVNITSESTTKFDTSKFAAGTYTFSVPGGSDISVTLAAGDNIADKFNAVTGNKYKMASDGTITKKDDGAFVPGVACKDNNGNSIAASHKTVYSIDLGSMISGATYELKVVSNNGNRVQNISFKAGESETETLNNLKAALGDSSLAPTANGNGIYKFGDGVAVANPVAASREKPVVERERIYSNNYIQLTLDAARALQNGDIEYANGCIDRIVSANEHLLVQIADLGSNEDFIDFNLEKLTVRDYNLAERQNDLEVTNAEEEITLLKTYEALYNACLQMSSSVIPNSIFNYMR